jgi:hypothetical protein
MFRNFSREGGPMPASPKLKLWLTGLSLIVLAAEAVTLAQGTQRAAQPKEPEWYVRAIEGDPSTRAVLEDAGINWVEFEYRLPANSKAVFMFVATAENGEIIKSLSKVNEVVAGDGENKGKVRLTSINPAAFTEDYQGKVRWVKAVGRSSGGGGWTENLYSSTGGRTSWTSGESVEKPKLATEYELWDIRAYPNGTNRITPNSPTAFKFQITFRYEQLGPNDLRGSSSEAEFAPAGKE